MPSCRPLGPFLRVNPGHTCPGPMRSVGTLNPAAAGSTRNDARIDLSKGRASSGQTV